MLRKAILLMSGCVILAAVTSTAFAADVTTTGYVQFQYSSDAAGAADTFKLGEVILQFKGKLSPTSSFEVEMDPNLNATVSGTQVNTKILKSYLVDLKNATGEGTNLRLGQFKLDFGIENILSASKRETVEKALVVSKLGPDRDQGLYLSGSAGTLGWGAGVFNGEGRNVPDANDGKDILLRGKVNAGALSLGASLLNGNKSASAAAKRRLGFDASVADGPFLARAEYIKGTDGTTDKSGYYALAGYEVTPSVTVVAKYDSFDKDNAAANDTETWKTVGIVQDLGGNALARVDYIMKDEEGTPVNNNVFIAQYQIKF